MTTDRYEQARALLEWSEMMESEVITFEDYTNRMEGREMSDPVKNWKRRSELYASLHERVAGTAGAKELAELQRLEEQIAAFTAEKHHEIIDRAENPGSYA